MFNIDDIFYLYHQYEDNVRSEVLCLITYEKST